MDPYLCGADMNLFIGASISILQLVNEIELPRGYILSACYLNVLERRRQNARKALQKIWRIFSFFSSISDQIHKSIASAKSQ